MLLQVTAWLFAGPVAAARSFAGLAPGSVLPGGRLVAPDGRSVYVAATDGGRVVRYDVPAPGTLRSIDVDGEPDGLASTPVWPKAACHACVAEQKGGPAP